MKNNGHIIANLRGQIEGSNWNWSSFWSHWSV